MGFDRLFDLGQVASGRGGLVKAIKAVLPNMAAEGAEEATTEATNLIADFWGRPVAASLQGVLLESVAAEGSIL